MFGRMRAASSPPDDLELARPPSKLIKDDSLSIYEATLVKLKLGARRDVDPAFDVAVETEADSASSSVSKCCNDALSCSHSAEAECNSQSVLKSSQLVLTCEDMTMTDTDFSSENISPSSSDCRSNGSLKQQRSKNVSILYLFSKYRSAGQAKSSSSQEEVMMTENDGSSASISQSSSNFQSLKSTKEQLDQDYATSVCHMQE